MVVAAPMNEEELRNMMFTAQLNKSGPFAIRYPKGNGVMPDWETPFTELEIGKGRKIKDGIDAAIITIGHVGNFALEAIGKLKKGGYNLALYDMRFVKPLDNKLLHEVFGKFDKVITVEDGTIIGGLGSAVLEFVSDNNYKAKVVRLGIPDAFIEQGTQLELYNECGYHVEGIIKLVKELVIK
jgi:1-deoxy-D-xylulose-5-phosphate synthase